MEQEQGMGQRETASIPDVLEPRSPYSRMLVSAVRIDGHPISMQQALLLPWGARGRAPG